MSIPIDFDIDPLVGIRAVAVAVDQSPRTIFRRIAEGKFPKPIKLNRRCNKWRISAIRKYVAELENEAEKSAA